jgi:epsin
MNALWKRLDEPGKHWRHVYKALLLLEYLIKNGSEQIPGEAKVHLLQIKTLKDFHYIDEDRKDVGLSVRERAKKLAELIADDDAVASERAKAAKNAGKYTGVSSDDYHGGSAPRHTDRASDTNGDADDDHHALDADHDDDEKPKPKPRKATAPKPKEPAAAAADPRPRAPSGGASSTPKPAPSASASLFDAFASAPSAPAVDPFGGSAFGAPAAAAADPFGGSAFGAPAAASPFGAPAAASPFGAPAASPFGAPAAASPFGAPTAASPFGAPAAASPFGAPAASSPFGATPFGAPAHAAAASPFGGFATPAAAAPAAAAPAAAADPFGSFGGFQSSAPTAAAADKGLAVDPLMNKTKNLWDLDGLGKKEESAVDHKRTVPMGAISTTGPARKASAAPAPSWATAGTAAPQLTPQQQQQQQQQLFMQQQQAQFGAFGGFSG